MKDFCTALELPTAQEQVAENIFCRNLIKHYISFQSQFLIVMYVEQKSLNNVTV